ncbi:hypothetical protein IQ07DRAFT_305893 [Pyrenochaeta sp. DS3sAY3a]|nr:hypothetical protein IQ07DRAFT_305893 [Pyrenochaeta sp. DS3sAY3a]
MQFHLIITLRLESYSMLLLAVLIFSIHMQNTKNRKCKSAILTQYPHIHNYTNATRYDPEPRQNERNGMQ